jgi:outer membrane protein TolC
MACAIAGCMAHAPVDQAASPLAVGPAPEKPIRSVVYLSWAPADGPTRAPPNGPSTSPFASLTELSVEALVQEVVARSPSLAQMTAAWQAASARYPQVTSLDDPMFGAQVAPGAFGSNTVDGGYRLEISQKLPWCGKLALRGQGALAEASAAGNNVEDMRLQLVESAKSAFYDFYLVARALEVNEEGLKLLREFRENAETRYRTGLAPQQDMLQADVEIGRQQERHLMLERLRQVAVARINTLMHLPPDLPLPPPPRTVTLAEPLPAPEALRQAALARRPDLRALADRIAAEQAALALAHKDFYPDFEVMAAYDTFWQEKQLRPQVGVRLNLPAQLGRRHGAIAEAQARIAERQAQLARQVDQVNFEVQQAFEQVLESERTVRLYEATILPAARENVEAARSAYTTARVPFLSLIEAQRNRVNLSDRYYEALADYHRRRATLERAIGGPPEQWPAPPGRPARFPHLPGETGSRP